MSNNWPLQSQCDAFYGNPRTAAFKQNLVKVQTPWKLTFAGQPVEGVEIHKKCADSLKRVFDAIWSAAGQDQSVIDGWGMSAFSGSYNYRPMRGGTHLSMHAYGCAVDFDAPHNGFGDHNPKFGREPAVLKAWSDEGWVWGGKWSKPDGMHWQAAIVG